MKTPFSGRWLSVMSCIVLILVSVYLFFEIVPFLAPVWRVIRTVGIPLLLSVVFAYLLHPVVCLIERTGFSRTVSIIILYTVFLGALAGGFWYASPILVRQAESIMAKLPEIERLVYQWLWWINQHIEQLPDGMHQGIDEAMLQLEDEVRNRMRNSITGFKDSFGNLFILLVIPFFVFYLLNDTRVLKRIGFRLIPRQHRRSILRIWKDIDHTLGEFIRGQVMISLIVGFLTLIGYFLIGLPYALSLAIFASAMNIIPYFGPLIGAMPAVFIAFVTDPVLVIWVVLLYTAIQVLEANVIAPYIMGRRLHIHPITIVLVLLVGAEIGGMIGLIFAVPTYIVIKVIFINTVQNKRPDQWQARH